MREGTHQELKKGRPSRTRGARFPATLSLALDRSTPADGSSPRTACDSPFGGYQSTSVPGRQRPECSLLPVVRIEGASDGKDWARVSAPGAAHRRLRRCPDCPRPE